MSNDSYGQHNMDALYVAMNFSVISDNKGIVIRELYTSLYDFPMNAKDKENVTWDHLDRMEEIDED